ncbi:MAG: ADP-ribosylglycohydrolase family protein [Bacillus subtilis]|nr:ADP-ribosylglycohydrolase family protein [Bacillus subtilis]
MTTSGTRCLSLIAMERYGANFTTYDIGKLWHEMLPYQLVCTAETQAYLNFAKVTHHLTGPKPADFETSTLPFVSHYQNPYREWIGGQIRVDGYAYAAAGNPLLAATLAYRDASLSHVKNGVYGAMFFAALIASAFVSQDIDLCIKQALMRPSLDFAPAPLLGANVEPRPRSHDARRLD